MRYLFLFFGLLIVGLAFGQNRSLDSLYIILNGHPKRDTVRVKILLSICHREVPFRPARNKALAEEALKISTKINFTRGIGNAHRYIADYHKVVGEYPLAIKHAYEMLRAFERIPYTIGINQAYQMLGILNVILVYQQQLMLCVLHQTQQIIDLNY